MDHYEDSDHEDELLDHIADPIDDITTNEIGIQSKLMLGYLLSPKLV